MERLLTLGSDGQRLVVEFGEAYDGPKVLSSRPYRHAQIHVEAGAFRGTVAAIPDEAQYRLAAEAFRLDGRARFGGHRDVLLTVDREGSTIEVVVIVTEDDPQVTLRYLIFE
jgi:hypothetical protein